jgi:hypothetical protein
MRVRQVFRMLPFAGITQIRFEGISHPAVQECSLQPGPLAFAADTF